jgi:hypothetical protein
MRREIHTPCQPQNVKGRARLENSDVGEMNITEDGDGRSLENFSNYPSNQNMITPDKIQYATCFGQSGFV